MFLKLLKIKIYNITIKRSRFLSSELKKGKHSSWELQIFPAFFGWEKEIFLFLLRKEMHYKVASMWVSQRWLFDDMSGTENRFKGLTNLSVWLFVCLQ